MRIRDGSAYVCSADRGGRLPGCALLLAGQAQGHDCGGPMTPDDFTPKHFCWAFEAGVATVTLNRPERKNPLTFASYAELRDTFRAIVYAPAVKEIGRAHV